jgi:formate hydrogenlyase transcriptional activator
MATAAEHWSGEAKYQALLAVAEAANAHRDLSGVLDAVAAALQDLVPIDLIGLGTRAGETLRPLAVHSGEEPRSTDESGCDYVRRLSETDGLAQFSPQFIAAITDQERTREPLIIEDVERDPRFQDAYVRRQGYKCLVMVLLTTGETALGGVLFARLTRTPFSPKEVRILVDISRPVATAVANALAFEQISALHTRLQEENVALTEEIDSSVAAGGIIGVSSALRRVLERVARVAATDTTVLITGETGTGKELVARAIHRASARARRALIKVNCAALAEGLVASELFGHERGAFTGATERRRGRFELADGGTILLDEVGDLPHPVQVSLLRVLQEGEFERVGGSQTLRTDARVVAATNRNIEEAVREGKLREDLFFRLNVFPIHLPPLRDRVDDIPLIAEYYAHFHGRKMGKAIQRIAPEAMAMLVQYPWPGNIRELQNVVERAIILARGHVLGVSDLEIPGLRSSGPKLTRPPGGPNAERQRIEEALSASRGRVSGPEGAAEALGIPPSTLESRIHRLGIDKHSFRRRASSDTAPGRN